VFAEFRTRIENEGRGEIFTEEKHRLTRRKTATLFIDRLA